MPAHKLRPQKLQCPFCPVIATRGTGLSAHVRAKHPRQYGKWNKNPNRLLDAGKGASPQLEVGNDRRSRALPSLAPVKVVEAAAVPAPPIQEEKPVLSAAHAPLTAESDVHDSLRLLQKAHEQLSMRKQSIETELVRIEELRGEHKAVTAQVAAIELAMKAFAPSEATPSSDTGAPVPVDAPDQALKTFQHHDAVALPNLHDGPNQGAETNVPVETKQVKPVPPKSRLSDEGRKRIVEATKKFWAAKRRAAQAVQGPRPTKGSLVSTKKADAGSRARH